MSKKYDLMLKMALLEAELANPETVAKKPRAPKVPEVPTLAPGTTQELPQFSKFGKLFVELDDIRSSLDYLKRYPDENPPEKKLASMVNKEKKLATATVKNGQQILDYIKIGRAHV